MLKCTLTQNLKDSVKIYKVIYNVLYEGNQEKRTICILSSKENKKEHTGTYYYVKLEDILNDNVNIYIFYKMMVMK